MKFVSPLTSVLAGVQLYLDLALLPRITDGNWDGERDEEDPTNGKH